MEDDFDKRGVWDAIVRRISKIDETALNPNAALLAEDPHAFLDSIHERDEIISRREVAEWIGAILGDKIDVDDLDDELRSGVKLLHLARTIQLIKCAHLKDEEYRKTVKHLIPDDVNFDRNLRHKRASLVARQRANIAKFLDWCRRFGVPSILLFESEDIVNEKNSRQVTTCLLYISKIAAKYGIEPPDSVKEEIEQEKRNKGKVTKDRRESPIERENPFIVTLTPQRNENAKDYATTSYELSESYNRNLDDYYGRTSTPSSLSNSLKLNGKQKQAAIIPPIELKFDEDFDADAVIIDAMNNTAVNGSQGRLAGVQSETDRIDDIEITETQDMVIINQLETYPDQYVPSNEVMEEQDTNSLEETLSPQQQDPNENSQRYSYSSTESMTTSENEYYTAHEVNMYDDFGDLMYHTAYVEEKDEAHDDPFPAEEILAHFEESETSSNATSSDEEEDVPTIPNEVILPPGWIRYRIPERDSKKNEEVVKHEVPQQSFNAEEQDITYPGQTSLQIPSYEESLHYKVMTKDVGVGTEDIKKDGIKEIMIDFPPYFEMPNRRPIRHVVVAPVAREGIYTVPGKRSKKKSVGTYTNEAFEECETEQTKVHTFPKRYQAPQRSEDATLPTEIPRYPRRLQAAKQTGLEDSSSSVSGKPRSEIGTQTHLSLSQDVVRVINEMGDISKIRKWSTSAGNVSAASDNAEHIPRKVGMYNNQPLPAVHKEIILVQSADLESAKPERYERFAGSSRFSHKGSERVYPKAFRRSVVSRASTIISEQLSKVVVTAKKYKTEIIVLCVLILLLIGGITAMVIDFTNL